MESNTKKSASRYVKHTVFIFIVLYLIAAKVNHIEDTDETFGYWEPIHFLLTGRGMQTWEYSPFYAIRTYAFIVPYALVAKPLSYFGNTFAFYGLRAFLGAFSAIAHSSFANQVGFNFGMDLGILTIAFMLSSYGMFISSCALLPSAVSSALMSFTFTTWLRRQHLLAIFFGSVTVLWTGWPFVGLMLLPVGLHMLYDVYCRSRSCVDVIIFSLCSVLVVVATGVPAVLMDSYFYGSWTCPTMNIFMYNAFPRPGGGSDELYGVEPASYYIKNLILNLGLAWPLFTALPVTTTACRTLAAVQNKMDAKKSKFEEIVNEVVPSVDARIYVIALSASLWLVTLFRRPHKEERFVYPAYPLICVAAAESLRAAVRAMECALGVTSSVTESTHIGDSGDRAVLADKDESEEEICYVQAAPAVSVSSGISDNLTIKNTAASVTTLAARVAALPAHHLERFGRPPPGAKSSTNSRAVIAQSNSSTSYAADQPLYDSSLTRHLAGSRVRTRQGQRRVPTRRGFHSSADGFAIENYTTKSFADSVPVDTTSSDGNMLKSFDDARPATISVIKRTVYGLCLLVTAALGISRALSQYRNNRGYLSLWEDALYTAGYNISTHSYNEPIKVCIGGEWHLFPSHFLLPANVSLTFYEDGFHGLLPRLFPAGGSRELGQGVSAAFNDVNREDRNRYTPLAQCDFVVTSSTAFQLDKLLNSQLSIKEQQKAVSVEAVLSRRVLNIDASKSAFTRAYYVPIYSSRHNVFKNYTIFVLKS